MPAPATTGPRVATGAAAIASAVAVAALPLTDAGPFVLLVRALGVAGVALAVAGVAFGWAAWGQLAALALGAELVATLHHRGPVVAPTTAVVAGGLLLVAELVAWSAEERTAGRPGTPPLRRATTTGAIVAASVVASAAVAGFVELPFGRDLALIAVGAGAVALVTGVLLATARASSGEEG
jgi:hypothetical protein